MNMPSPRSDQFPLRLPDGRRERIKAKAKENLRSMNAEIVVQLARLYPAHTETKKGSVSA
jgi:hypothetical protein